MHFSSKRFRAKAAAIGIILVSSVGLSVAAVTPDSDRQTQNAAYLENIITVLRAHVLSMRAIIDDNELKYADNMVRHARAFERAIGMVGPMDWHAARAFEKAQQSAKAVNLTEAQFEELAKVSDRRIDAINRAANRYMTDKNAERMNAAIDGMIESCGACHSQMPKGTVPSVWAGMRQ